MLETKNIYLDTQIFVQNNYFKSSKIQEIANLANNNQINLFFTEITLNEIKSICLARVCSIAMSVADSCLSNLASL